MNTTRRGFTLLEVLIAGSILATMLMISISVMMAMADSSKELKGETFAQQVAGRTVEDIARLIRQANVAPNAATFKETGAYRFQVPVDADPARAGEQLLSPDGAAAWGARGREGEYYELSFVPSGREYNEAEAGVAINVDGDLTDTYEIGRIVLGYCESAAASPYKTVDLTPDIVLRYKESVATGTEQTQTIDGEPFVSTSGESHVDITVMAADFSTDQPHLVKAKTQVALYNVHASE